MTKLESLMPLFIVADLGKSVAFYREVLGFDLSMSIPAEDPFFAIVARDRVGIMLKHIAPDVPPLPNPARHPYAKWDAFIRTEDPDALASELQGRTSEIACAVQDTDDGLRGFEISDVDGYALFFGRPLEL